ncbi:HlyD family secretion protein [Blastochloris viridis]|uniref:HlyD family secretion protein n=1 Tax=Blastochloris viridis TaxID=1079 RepID=A0A0H5B6J6_BLAVI|nr:HlyD family efflux transporter periplasmic adaptor subunit [Blastochloris viridis]ALK08902.1 Multidrug resistance protein MdtN [Blastochloris viridis]BAR97795.1 HlyD family secretion protein [Blastochloris viridis]CUU41563.1 Macrolide-specific efflux protein macA precursor [Blastochloris viridis]
MRMTTVVAALAIVAAGAAGGYVLWSREAATRVPEGFARANGRIEVERVDVATKIAGRIAELRVREGDDVTKGMLVARLDSTELRAQLAAAKAAVLRAEQAIIKAEADVASQEASLVLAELELSRGTELGKRSVASVSDVDKRRAQRDVAKAVVDGAKAAVGDAKAAREVAIAQVDQIQATLDETDLTAPVAGRVEYKLTQPGAVLAAGGRVVTLLDLTDVYMTVFLPTAQVGKVALGSDARIILDAGPQFVIPARVSFIAAEAQFTPKAVETVTEREKLMYRLKVSIDPKLLTTYRNYVKAGLTGYAYLRIDPDAAWPASLQPKLPDVR